MTFIPDTLRNCILHSLSTCARLHESVKLLRTLPMLVKCYTETSYKNVIIFRRSPQSSNSQDKLLIILLDINLAE